MCGIFGYIGPRNDTAQLILKGLKALEYRGYDSWGIAVNSNGEIKIDRHTGKIGGAETKLENGNGGIGHTRWATHGGVTEANAHPHMDGSKTLAVVHNGIVENYIELKAELKNKGHEFNSETDSEVIAHLLQEDLQKNSLKDAVVNTFNQVEGSNAFCVFDNKTQSLGMCRDGSPLVIGIGDGEYFVGSDVTPFLEFTKNVIFLDDGDGAVITSTGVELFSARTGEKKEAIVTAVDWEAEDAQKEGHPHFLIKEILEQKKTIAKTTTINQEVIERVSQKIKDGFKVSIIGCGTAAFCGFAGRYFFADQGIEATAYGAYEMSPFTKFIDEKTICIAISQSGETADTLIAVKAAKKNGAHIVGIINARGSTLERIADETLLVGTGPEIAVISTKAYTAQLATLYQLAYAAGSSKEAAIQNIRTASDAINSWLTDAICKQIQNVALKLIDHNHVYVIGKHINNAAGQECALKIKETSYIHAESFASGELKHGVIALIDQNTPCVVMGSNDDVFPEVMASASEMKARGGYIIGISPQNSEEFDEHITTPDIGDLTILGNVIVGQLLGYYTALGRGTDPDKPRNLAKSVTVK